jgi:flagellum-specific peptidoglycan hydrolase FlgJ
MQKRPFQFLACLLFLALSSSAQHASIHVKDYIAKFRDIAIEEMKRTGVPASITLAQGIHESDAGRSNLVMRSNNHFGIKCKSDWKGESVSHDDDARGECFRKYDSPFQSYIDHSDFLKTRSHYAFLFNLDPTDYEAWAHGLKKAGYATNPKYPQILIKLIRDYNLQDYTLVALGHKEPTFQTEPVVTTTRTPQLIQEAKREDRNEEENS